MSWSVALLVGMVSNFDNLGAGVAFGIRGTRIGTVANLIVAGITMATTAACVTSGQFVSSLLPSEVAGWLGPLVIIAIGVATLLTSSGPPGSPGPAHASRGAWRHGRPVDGVISCRQAVVLGIALSANNLATGLGAGVTGVPAFATTLSAGALSLVCMGGGARVGKAFGGLVLGRHAPLIGGMALLTVGAAMLASVH